MPKLRSFSRFSACGWHAPSALILARHPVVLRGIAPCAASCGSGGNESAPRAHPTPGLEVRGCQTWQLFSPGSTRSRSCGASRRCRRPGSHASAAAPFDSSPNSTYPWLTVKKRFRCRDDSFGIARRIGKAVKIRHGPATVTGRPPAAVLLPLQIADLLPLTLSGLGRHG